MPYINCSGQFFCSSFYHKALQKSPKRKIYPNLSKVNVKTLHNNPSKMWLLRNDDNDPS